MVKGEEIRKNKQSCNRKHTQSMLISRAIIKRYYKRLFEAKQVGADIFWNGNMKMF